MAFPFAQVKLEAWTAAVPPESAFKAPPCPLSFIPTSLISTLFSNTPPSTQQRLSLLLATHNQLLKVSALIPHMRAVLGPLVAGG